MPPRSRLLQPADATLAHALVVALAEVPLDPRDVPARLLASKLAASIDADPAALERLAPRLLAVLAELQLTPRVRGAKEVQASGPSALDRLRAVRPS